MKINCDLLFYLFYYRLENARSAINNLKENVCLFNSDRPKFDFFSFTFFSILYTHLSI